ncbi:hypothetical protein HC928_17325 [bacterium]|nr:hypothetical protein [bacterium]
MAIHSQPASDDEENRQEAFLRKLADLPPKTRRNRTRATHMELIATWYPHLKSAHDKGYTYDELAGFIASEAGISIYGRNVEKVHGEWLKRSRVLLQSKPVNFVHLVRLYPLFLKTNPIPQSQVPSFLLIVKPVLPIVRRYLTTTSNRSSQI